MTKNWTKYIILGLVGLSLAPFLWLLTRADVFGSQTHAVANTLGLVGSVLLVWQFILRNRHFSRLFQDDYLAFDRVHKTIGIWGMLLVFMHPFLERLEHSDSLLWTFALDFGAGEFEQRVSFGRLALMLLLLTWILSVFFRKQLPYRLWRRLHLLVYLILPLVMLHAPFVGTFMSAYPAVKAYWWAWMGLWVGLVLWRLLNYFNVGKVRYQLIDKQLLASGITRYTLAPKDKKLQPKPGQFMYVRGFFFSEVHPFSVMEFDQKTGNISFGIKEMGKYTRQLANIPLKATVYLDGPYGMFTREGQNNDPKVVIAGGIGITPFVELIRRFGGKDTYLIYANRSLDLAIKRQEFMRELEDNYIDVISGENETCELVIHGIVDTNVLKDTLPAASFNNSRFFLCGPPAFMAGVQKNLLQLGVERSRIYSEEFSL